MTTALFSDGIVVAMFDLLYVVWEVMALLVLSLPSSILAIK